MIGYKEFSCLDLDNDPLSDPQFGDMLERMKLSTYQYARSQIKWIKKQLLPAVKEARSLGGDVQVYVVKGGEEGYAPSIRLLQRESIVSSFPLIVGFLDGQEIEPEETHPDARDLLSELYAQENQLLPDTLEQVPSLAKLIVDVNR
jgi:tRNA dimethylallyltransferase